MSLFSNLYAFDVTTQKGTRYEFLVQYTRQILDYETRSGVVFDDGSCSVVNDPELNQITTHIDVQGKTTGKR